MNILRRNPDNPLGLRYSPFCPHCVAKSNLFNHLRQYLPSLIFNSVIGNAQNGQVVVSTSDSRELWLFPWWNIP